MEVQQFDTQHITQLKKKVLKQIPIPAAIFVLRIKSMVCILPSDPQLEDWSH